MSYPFLSAEWMDAAKAIREKYADQSSEITISVRMNQVITDVPFGDGDVKLYLDTSSGKLEMESGELETPDLTLTTDYDTAQEDLRRPGSGCRDAGVHGRQDQGPRRHDEDDGDADWHAARRHRQDDRDRNQGHDRIGRSTATAVQATAPTEADASGEQQDDNDDQQDCKHGQDLPGSLFRNARYARVAPAPRPTRRPTTSNLGRPKRRAPSSRSA